MNETQNYLEFVLLRCTHMGVKPFLFHAACCHDNQLNVVCMNKQGLRLQKFHYKPQVKGQWIMRKTKNDSKGRCLLAE